MKMRCSECGAQVSRLVNKMCVDCYLDNFLPSKTGKQPWVYASSLQRGGPDDFGFDEILAEAIMSHSVRKSEDKNGFIILIDDKELFIPFDVSAIDDLAAKSGIRVGKWLIYRERDVIDSVWKMIAKATIEGELGVSAKASTTIQGKIRHVICVYTENYLDLGDVEKVREILYDMGFSERLCYKPDIYTYLGIYYRTTPLSACRYRR